MDTEERETPMTEQARYTVFTRTWWKHNESWPDGREPSIGKKRTLAKNLSYDEALRMCKEWNAAHKPGKLSRKAEFTAQ
jgi:hypothetical protein